MAKQEYTFDSICREIQAKKFHPLYLLMGEEPYFIDKITDLLLENVLNETERDFNQITLYGADTKVTDLLNTVRRYPMMSEYQLVVVREAQEINKLDLLTSYVEHPLKSTILVINYKYDVIDKRKKIVQAIEQHGIVYESKKIPDYKLVDFIISVMRKRSIETDDKAASMLADYLGNDLALLHKELDKLLLLLSGQPNQRITAEIIEKNIGISKDFNVFELQNAIARKEILKANRIVRYFGEDPNNHPIQNTLSVLFNYFSNLLICFYAQDKSEQALMHLLNFRYPIQVKEYLIGMKKYSAVKVFNLIHEIRMADARSKGMDATSSLTNGEILKELLYKILH